MDGMREEVSLENALFQSSDDVTPIIPFDSKYRLALADICDGLKQWRIWLLLAWQDVKLRYRVRL